MYKQPFLCIYVQRFSFLSRRFDAFWEMVCKQNGSFLIILQLLIGFR